MLLLDCGNTRLKWRHISPARVQQGIFDYHTDTLQAAPFWSLLQADDVIWAASVAKLEWREQLEQVAQQRQLRVPRFAISEVRQGGVINGYREPQKLGIDRWLAILAAWRECRTACIIIDAGSALTVDIVDHEGHHQGGHIVPGLALQQRSLLTQTAQVRFDADHRQSIAPGRDTQAAVLNGTLAMAIGYLRYLLHEAWHSSPTTPVIFITGGDAERLLPLLNVSANVRPHLVLDGLYHYAQEHP